MGDNEKKRDGFENLGELAEKLEKDLMAQIRDTKDKIKKKIKEEEAEKHNLHRSKTLLKKKQVQLEREQTRLNVQQQAQEEQQTALDKGAAILKEGEMKLKHGLKKLDYEKFALEKDNFSLGAREAALKRGNKAQAKRQTQLTEDKIKLQEKKATIDEKKLDMERMERKLIKEQQKLRQDLLSQSARNDKLVAIQTRLLNKGQKHLEERLKNAVDNEEEKRKDFLKLQKEQESYRQERIYLDDNWGFKRAHKS